MNRIVPALVVGGQGRDGRARFTVVGEADWQVPPVSDWVASVLAPLPTPPPRR